MSEGKHSDSEPTLKQLFIAYTRFGRAHADKGEPTLDSTQYKHWLTDAGLLKPAGSKTSKRSYDTTSADIDFAKRARQSGVSGAHRVDYDHLRRLCVDIGAKCKPELGEDEGAAWAEGRLQAVGAPSDGKGVTRAEAVRFYDNIDDDRKATEERVARRERRRSSTGSHEDRDVDYIREMERRSSGTALTASPGTLKHVFLAFCRGHRHDKSTADFGLTTWITLLRDSGLLHPKRYNETSAELTFTRHVTRGSKLMDFAQFKVALQEVAAARFSNLKDATEATRFSKAEAKVIETGGPAAASGTRPDEVRLADVDAREAVRHERSEKRERRRSEVKEREAVTEG